MLRPMDESGFDTLKATRALEAAGFESGQAEAMVTVFGGAILANVATKSDVLAVKDEMAGPRTELQGQIAGLRTELKGEIAGLRMELQREIAGVRLSVESLRASMYKLLLAQAVLIVGLIPSLQRLL